MQIFDVLSLTSMPIVVLYSIAIPLLFCCCVLHLLVEECGYRYSKLGRNCLFFRVMTCERAVHVRRPQNASAWSACLQVVFCYTFGCQRTIPASKPDKVQSKLFSSYLPQRDTSVGHGGRTARGARYEVTHHAVARRRGCFKHKGAQRAKGRVV